MTRIPALAKVVWKPITTRFKEAEAKMAMHEKMLLQELHVISEESLTNYLSEVRTFVGQLGSGDVDEKVVLSEQMKENMLIGR